MVVGFGESGSHGILKGEGAGVGVQREALARGSRRAKLYTVMGLSEEFCQGTKWVA